MSVSYRRTGRDDLAAAADFIIAANRLPEQRCLGLDATDRDALTRELTAHTDDPRLIVGEQNGALVGLLGCDYVDRPRRAWLWGPYIAHDDWHAVAGALLARLFELLPKEIAIADSFVDIANQRAHRFFLERGYADRGQVHIYDARRGGHEEEGSPNAPLTQLAAAHGDSLIKLHDASFPNSYLSGHEIVTVALADADGGGDHCTYVTTDGELVTGYVYASLDDSGDGGYIDFLAVRPSHRRRGLARSLLNGAMRWLFEAKRVPSVTLTVEGGRTNARALYESVGFTLETTGVTARWTASSAGNAATARTGSCPRYGRRIASGR